MFFVNEINEKQKSDEFYLFFQVRKFYPVCLCHTSFARIFHASQIAHLQTEKYVSVNILKVFRFLPFSVYFGEFSWADKMWVR